MIPLREVDEEVRSQLDANGSDAYDLNFARIPATNAAQNQLMSAVRSFQERNSMVGESLRDLNYTAVFQTTEAGQVALDTLLALAPLGHKLWSVMGVHPEFDSYEPQSIVADPIATNSRIRTDLRYIRSRKSSKLYTQEAQSDVSMDIFAPGNSIVPSDNPTVEFGHTLGSTAVVTGGQQVGVTLTITPHTIGTRRLVAVSYLKVPSTMPNIPTNSIQDPVFLSAQLEWPASCKGLLVSVIRRILAIPIGDGTTQYVLSKEEENQLLRAIY